MVAFNPRGDHFIPPPVPLGRWGSAPPDFSSLLSLHHCKEEVGLGGWEMCGSRAWLVVSLWLSFLFATQRESFPSPERVVSGRQGIGAAKCSRPIPKQSLWAEGWAVVGAMAIAETLLCLTFKEESQMCGSRAWLVGFLLLLFFCRVKRKAAECRAAVSEGGRVGEEALEGEEPSSICSFGLEAVG